MKPNSFSLPKIYWSCVANFQVQMWSWNSAKSWSRGPV